MVSISKKKADGSGTTRTVKWSHPSVKIRGKGYGAVVELDSDVADALEATGRCVPLDTLLPGEFEAKPGEIIDEAAYELAKKAGTITELEAPDAEGESDG